MASLGETAFGAKLKKQRQNALVAVVRANEIRLLLRHLYGKEVPDTPLGRAHLQTLFEAQAWIPDGRRKMRNFAECFVPWLSPGKAEALIDSVMIEPPRRNADQIAERLGLTFALRQKLGLTTIGSIDVDQHARAELRRQRAAERERNRRIKIKRQKQATTEALAKQLCPRADALLKVGIPAAGWISTGDLLAECRGWLELEGAGQASALRAIRRACDELVSRGLVQEEERPSKTRRPSRWFRRV